jgi:hypothetical protein
MKSKGQGAEIINVKEQTLQRERETYYKYKGKRKAVPMIT